MVVRGGLSRVVRCGRDLNCTPAAASSQPAQHLCASAPASAPPPLAPCRDKDPREDLKTLARMYCTALEMQMRDRSRWVLRSPRGGGREGCMRLCESSRHLARVLKV